MKYISTRGNLEPAEFETALLTGLAADGGLFVPEHWPRSNLSLAAISELSFAAASAQLLTPLFEPWIDEGELNELAASAYSSFDDPRVAPLIQIDKEIWLLELFHGPTLAFKDIAMQLLGELFDHALARQNERVTVIAATSGDTGGAAIEAFRGRSNVDVVILHPKGRISDVQRRMMTTVPDPNVCNVAIDGTFDDCQRIVKALFADQAFKKEVNLSSVNSINWARLAIQSVYYFTSLAEFERRVGATTTAFAVPTGNFGDAFAGYVAKQMGADISTLCIAVNHNDLLHRALTTGVYEPKHVVQSTSPSMDIQFASNFERLIFEASGRDAACVCELMEELDKRGSYRLPDDCLTAIRQEFVSERVSEKESARTIQSVFSELGILLDPHTAVGLTAAQKALAAGRMDGPVIVLGTAHPAKFPETIQEITGVSPKLPARFINLFEMAEYILKSPPDARSVKDIIQTKADLQGKKR